MNITVIMSHNKLHDEMTLSKDSDQ